MELNSSGCIIQDLSEIIELLAQYRILERTNFLRYIWLNCKKRYTIEAIERFGFFLFPLSNPISTESFMIAPLADRKAGQGSDVKLN